MNGEVIQRALPDRACVLTQRHQEADTDAGWGRGPHEDAGGPEPSLGGGGGLWEKPGLRTPGSQTCSLQSPGKTTFVVEGSLQYSVMAGCGGNGVGLSAAPRSNDARDAHLRGAVTSTFPGGGLFGESSRHRPLGGAGPLRQRVPCSARTGGCRRRATSGVKVMVKFPAAPPAFFLRPEAGQTATARVVGQTPAPQTGANSAPFSRGGLPS